MSSLLQQAEKLTQWHNAHTKNVKAAMSELQQKIETKERELRDMKSHLGVLMSLPVYEDPYQGQDEEKAKQKAEDQRNFGDALHTLMNEALGAALKEKQVNMYRVNPSGGKTAQFRETAVTPSYTYSDDGDLHMKWLDGSKDWTGRLYFHDTALNNWVFAPVSLPGLTDEQVQELYRLHFWLGGFTTVTFHTGKQ